MKEGSGPKQEKELAGVGADTGKGEAAIGEGSEKNVPKATERPSEGGTGGEKPSEPAAPEKKKPPEPAKPEGGEKPTEPVKPEGEGTNKPTEPETAPEPPGEKKPPEAAKAEVVKDAPSKELPQVKKAVNSDIQHASERAVERGVFADKKSAAEALRDLSKKIKKDGLPPGTIPDPKRPDSVLVPYGKGYAVYEITKKGTAVLRTVIAGS